MMTITIYSKNNCVYCNKAKALVKNLGLEYEEKSLEKDFAVNVMAAVKKIVAKEVLSTDHDDTIKESLNDFRK